MLENLAKSQRRTLFASLASTILLGVIIVSVVSLYFNSSLGWFANNRNVDGTGMSVHAEGMALPPIRAWRFDMDGGETEDSLDKSGHWVEGLDELTTTDSNDLVAIEENNGDGEKYRTLSLHLGTVDNLLTLNEDNCFYIRIDVTDATLATLGTGVRARYRVTDLKFFDSDGRDQTATIRQDHSDAYDILVNLIDVDCAVSLTSRSMTGMSADTDVPIIEGFFNTRVTTPITEDTNQYIQLDRGGDVTSVYSAPEIEGNPAEYYLYVRLRPDLETVFAATYDISSFMPCQLVFDISLEFEFYSPAT